VGTAIEIPRKSSRDARSESGFRECFAFRQHIERSRAEKPYSFVKSPLASQLLSESVEFFAGETVMATIALIAALAVTLLIAARPILLRRR
jgi:hypothetical protein